MGMTTTTHTNSVSLVHDGYVDGLNGLDPNPSKERSDEYSKGWLAGYAQHEAGVVVPKYLGYCESFEALKAALKNSPKITVLKGTTIRSMGPESNKVAKKTYTVDVKLMNNGSIAYIDYHTGEVVPPTNPTLTWAGAGSYWHDVDVNDVPEAQQF